MCFFFLFFFQAEDGIRDKLVTGVQTCALPISSISMVCASRKASIASSTCRGFPRPQPLSSFVSLLFIRMNLLVTGGAGFIGSNVIHHIIERPEIARLVNLDCLTYAGHLANLEVVSGHSKYVFEKVDLRDKAGVLRVVQQHGISHVMHLAAESHVDRSITGPGDFIHTNIVGTFHLLEACRACWLDPHSPLRTPHSSFRFHHVSTDEVYGSLGATGFFTETTPYAPNSPYSASKASSDLLVRAYHHTYGLPMVITNCSNNYGPFQFPEKLIPVVIQCALHRANIPVYGDGMNVRDWLYVRDHAEALWQVLTRGAGGQTDKICGGTKRGEI